MWLSTLLVMVSQFLVMLGVTAVVVFNLVDWMKQDDA